LGLIGAFQDLGKLGVSHLSLTCFGKQAQGGSDVAQGDELPEPIVDVLIVIDPNSFLGEVNIQKGNFCVKGICRGLRKGGLGYKYRNRNSPPWVQSEGEVK